MRRLAPLFSLCLALGCGSPTGLTTSFRLGEPFGLDPGEVAVESAGLTTVRYIRLIADSRCLPPMVCVWQGEATIEVGLSVGDAAEQVVQLNLYGEPRGAVFQPLGRAIEFRALEPETALAGPHAVRRARLLVTAIR